MSLFHVIASTFSSAHSPARQNNFASGQSKCGFSISRLSKLTMVLLLSVVVSACGGKKKKQGGIPENLAKQQVQELYSKGKAALDRGNYGFAIDFYRALEANYPYGELTEQAKLDMMFAFDKTNQIDLAVAAADNFIKLYPTHKNVDYAYYMKGVASFEKKAGRLDKFIKGGAKTVRDPKPFRDSQEAFEELLKRYPNSIYAKDAEQRIVYIRNALAERELQVAQFYYDSQTYVAAVNRSKTIIYTYETSPAVEGALILMEKAYTKMGLDDLAASTNKVLVENFPDNKNTPYRKKKSIFARINPF